MKTRKILLIEPHPDIADAIEEILVSAGFQVRVTGNLDVLLSNTDFRGFDMIIADTENNCALNYEVARRRKHSFILSKVFLIGNYGISDKVKTLRDQGADGVFVKPLDFDVFISAIECEF